MAQQGQPSAVPSAEAHAPVVLDHQEEVVILEPEVETEPTLPPEAEQLGALMVGQSAQVEQIDQEVQQLRWTLIQGRMEELTQVAAYEQWDKVPPSKFSADRGQYDEWRLLQQHEQVLQQGAPLPAMDGAMRPEWAAPVE